MKWKNTHKLLSEDNDTNESRTITIERPTDNQPRDNKIYFYSDINLETILSLNQQIDEMTKHMKIVQINYDLVEPPPIELHICTDGGEVYAAMAAVDKILNNKVSINTYCEGIVASAGTLLSCVGKKRYITKNSSMLLHQVSGSFWGNFMQIVDEHQNFQLIMKMIKKIYIEKSKFKSKEIDELLKHDLCLDAEACLRYGIVDKII